MWLHYKVKLKTPSSLLNLKERLNQKKIRGGKILVIKETETVKPEIVAYPRILWWLQTKFVWPCQRNEWSRSMSWQITCTVWGCRVQSTIAGYWTLGPSYHMIISSYKKTPTNKLITSCFCIMKVSTVKSLSFLIVCIWFMLQEAIVTATKETMDDAHRHLKLP